MSNEMIRRASKDDWNVINREEFKNNVKFVFDNVSDSLKNTLGPYGSTTIIEQFGEYHPTKDGWQVLKKITFTDQIHRNIMQLLFNIAAQVVIKVGDGSTSSIMAANTVLNELDSSDLLKELRPKDFIDILNKLVGQICDVILKNSTKINKETDPEYNDIKRLAMISTNGDEHVSSIIQKIYQETDNPTIEFDKGTEPVTTYEIIDGYRSDVISYLNKIYAETETGDCVVKNPLILMFNHCIDIKTHLDYIINPAIQLALESGRQLVVIAPQYDRRLLDRLSTVITNEFKALGKASVVYCRASLIGKDSVQLYHDFALMCGATIISDADIEGYLPSTEGTVESNVKDVLGTVELITVGEKKTTVKGFTNRNEHLYQKYLLDAQNKYLEVEARSRELGIVNNDLYIVKQRLAKLRCRMGIIKVGGYSTMERTALYDLVDDAVKACESAFTHGYNMGGNLIIPSAINSITTTSANEIIILDLLNNAFRDVFKAVLSNKYTSMDDETINSMIERSIAEGATYNLITNQYDKNVINSCLTDIEILKATTSIVSLIVTSNQYLTIKM